MVVGSGGWYVVVAKAVVQMVVAVVAIVVEVVAADVAIAFEESP